MNCLYIMFSHVRLLRNWRAGANGAITIRRPLHAALDAPAKEFSFIRLHSLRSSVPDRGCTHLGYNDRVVIERSVDLQWTRPSYTGGVAVVNYTVNSTSGGTVTVEDTSEDVKYSPGLIYGDVMVTAINTCGLESQPAAINIPAAGHYNYNADRKVAITSAMSACFICSKTVAI